jgi:hypothetical protein
MIDEKKEAREVELWNRNDLNREMSTEDMNQIVQSGITRCGEMGCLSRKLSGDDACICIRSIFPSAEHYGLYLEMREWYLDRLAEKVAMATVGEKND